VKLTRPVIGNANPISLDDRSDSSDESTGGPVGGGRAFEQIAIRSRRSKADVRERKAEENWH
jgi:hypothetical protein